MLVVSRFPVQHPGCRTRGAAMARWIWRLLVRFGALDKPTICSRWTLTRRKWKFFADITPDGDAQNVHEYLDARLSTSKAREQNLKRILLVSHMPLVSYLVDAMCDSYTTSLFATASIAVIRYNVHTHKGSLEAHYQGR